MGGSAGVHLQVEAERLAEVGDLHDAGDAQVILGVGMDHVAAAGHQERRLLLQGADMLGDQQRCRQPLTQAAVRLGGDASVPIRVLVPEAADLVTGAADCQGVVPGAELAGWVQHDAKAVAHPRPDRAQVFDLAHHIAVVPAVNLETREAGRLAFGGEVRERLRGVQSAGTQLAVVGAGVGRQPLAEAAQEPRHRGAQPLASQIPEGDVQRAVPHVVVGAQLPL